MEQNKEVKVPRSRSTRFMNDRTIIHDYEMALRELSL